MEAFSMECREAFARELQRYIERNNQTQKEFAQEAGFSASMVSNWLNCVVLPEELTRLYQIAGATDTDVFKWVSLLLGQEYRCENIVQARDEKIKALEVEIAALRARAG